MISELVHGRPYHPQSNGGVEKVNMTVKHSIEAVLHDHPEKQWDDVLMDVVHAYNRKVHRTIKRQPYAVFHGRDYVHPPLLQV